MTSNFCLGSLTFGLIRVKPKIPGLGESRNRLMQLFFSYGDGDLGLFDLEFLGVAWSVVHQGEGVG